MSESLVLKILSNFESELALFKAKSPNSLIKEYFKQKGATHVKYYYYKRTKHQLIGQTKQRVADGHCIIRYRLNDYYIGKVKNNRKDGFGYHRFVNGLIYKGEYANGKKVNGSVFNPESKSVVYEGGWAKDLYNGHGRLARPSGEVYEGDFKDGQFHGNGVLTWRNGARYEGQFVSGKREGRGLYTNVKGHIYEGGFKENKFEGEGVYRWGNLDEFKGSFSKGEITGSGIMSYRELGISGSGVWNSVRNIESVVFDLDVGTNRELYA